MNIDFFVILLIQISIYSLLSVSFNFSLGFTGLINLGHIAFYGLGAYASAIFWQKGLPVYLTILIGGLIAAVISYGLIFSIRKLKGDYLAMATLSFNFVVYSLFLNLDDLTSGSQGITNIERPWGLNDNFAFLVFVALVSTSCIYMMRKILISPLGKMFQGTRDDEVLIRSLGKNTFELKVKSITISAFFAGVAGGLWGHFIGFIHPSFFYLNEVILLLTIVIVGGLSSIKGTVLATFIIILLPEMIRLFNVPQSILGPMRQIIYQLTLLIILLFNSRGIFGKIDLE